jgi:ankyrin repeat protein
VFSQGGHVEVVKALLGAGATLEAVNRQGDTAMAVAAQEGQAAVVKVLAQAGAAVDRAAADGWTPLHMAAHNGYVHRDSAQPALLRPGLGSR